AGHPESHRIERAFHLEAFALPATGIRAAQAYQRPAVVAASLDAVEFVTAVGPHFRSPDVTGDGVLRQPGGRAVAVAEDFRQVVFVTREGVVLRNAPFRRQAQDLALLRAGMKMR